MNRHPEETALALFAGGDLPLTQRLGVSFHVSRCAQCAGIVDEFRSLSGDLRREANEMPERADWRDLSEEMTGNIRVGYAAAECIRPFRVRAATGGTRPGWFWKPAAMLFAGMALVTTVWISTMPADQTQAISRILRGVRNADTPGIMLEASMSGIELRQGTRSAMRVLVKGSNPGQVSANLDGSMRAQYVDDNTGQVTVTNVYAQ